MDWTSKKEKSEKSMRLERINNLISIVDFCLAHPFLQEIRGGEYNYSKAFRVMKLISNSAFPDFAKKEIDADKENREKIKDFIKKYSIYKLTNIPSMVGSTRVENKFISINWEGLEELLTNYYQFLLNCVAVANKGFSYTDEDTSGTVIEGGDDDSS